MIDVIEKEEREYKKYHLVPSYSKLGKRSIIRFNEEWRGGNSNCLDWVREKSLLADIKLEESSFENIAAWSRLYTNNPSFYIDKSVEISI